MGTLTMGTMGDGRTGILSASNINRDEEDRRNGSTMSN